MLFNFKVTCVHGLVYCCWTHMTIQNMLACVCVCVHGSDLAAAHISFDLSHALKIIDCVCCDLDDYYLEAALTQDSTLTRLAFRRILRGAW